MESLTPFANIETRRMGLRGVIHLASEVVAQYWPMRTFVHHNPLHNLEYLPFKETVIRGKQFLGGNGYLPSEFYRHYLRSGRIQSRHMETAVAPLARDEYTTIGLHRVSHGEVLCACLAEGLCTPVEEPLDARWEHDPYYQLDVAIANRLEAVLPSPDVDERVRGLVSCAQASLGRLMTLSHWCDQVLGSAIVDRINHELIKWCGGFLDEGHATWAMPEREQGLYLAWKALAAHEWSPCGISDSKRKIASLPNYPEDAVLESLDALGIPEDLRQDYLSLQLTALPGWTGFIKWRSEKCDYEWQQAYPVEAVEYLAIRLWYVRELVQQTCQQELGIAGTYQSVTDYMRQRSKEYFLRRERAASRLPAIYAEEVDRLQHQRAQGWDKLYERYQLDVAPRQLRVARHGAAKQLRSLALALQLDPATLMTTAPDKLACLVEWMKAFPESDHGPVWLKAFESGYQEQLLGALARSPAAQPPLNVEPGLERLHSQTVFCMDVRSEPFRRHLELSGANGTYGFAGFFAAFIRYRAWGKEHDTEQFPVIMRAKNEVREIPRSYHDHVVSKHKARTRIVHAGHTLLHDLKENVVTPYVMAESVGWFYGFPIIGKTFLPTLHGRLTSWLQRLFVPSIATTLTVDKLAPTETAEMLMAEQQTTIRQALQECTSLRSSQITLALVEALRQWALSDKSAPDAALLSVATPSKLSGETLNRFVTTLRQRYAITQRSASRKKERITRTGLTLDEQILTVGTALRMMGLTRQFARLVLFCAHGSTSENNPFESALDCGACGGNEGKPNARLLAMMANNQKVRERLAKTGLVIPSDTHFLAGQVDTTTDEVQLFDLEDAPPAHCADIARLIHDLNEASRRTSLERCSRFPDLTEPLPIPESIAHVHRRSADWSQVRPEWGLSSNASLVIGRRDLTKGVDLGGRVFLQSYDYREDPGGHLLEVLMIGPQVVAQWINMEHYFSTVDNEAYGSGSKIYHNVVGRVGIMSGPWSDLRLGLAQQTVMNGDVPYHEPMRLLSVIEAPREWIEKLIPRHEVLRQFYHNEWVHLVVLEPEEGILYQYRPTGEWAKVDSGSGF